MKKNDITYEYRVFTNRLIDVDSMEVGNCTSKVIKEIKSKDKVDGRFFHTSDTDEWFYCWNGELQKLNLKGDSDVNAALAEVEKLIDEANAAVSEAKNIASEAKDAADAATKAAEDANAAVESIGNKADKSEVEAKADKSDVEAVSKEVEDLSAKVDAIPSVEEIALKSDLDGYATEEFVLAKIAEAELNDKDVDLSNYATKEDISNLASKEEVAAVVEGYATETWVNGQGFLTEHQDITGKQDVIEDLAVIREGATLGKTALQSIPDEYVTEEELNSKGYLTEHQDLSGKQDVISDLAEIREGAAAGATALQEIPAEYITESELNDKGYLTEESLNGFAKESDLANYFTKEEINAMFGNINDLIGEATTITNTILNA